MPVAGGGGAYRRTSRFRVRDDGTNKSIPVCSSLQARMTCKRDTGGFGIPEHFCTHTVLLESFPLRCEQRTFPRFLRSRLSSGQSFRTTPSSSGQAMQPDRRLWYPSRLICMYIHMFDWRGTPQMTHPTFLPYPAWQTLGCDTSIENTHKLQGWQLPGRKVIDVPLRPCSLWSARHSPVFL